MANSLSGKPKHITYDKGCVGQRNAQTEIAVRLQHLSQ